MVNKQKTSKYLKKFTPKRANIADIGGEPLELPNLSGIGNAIDKGPNAFSGIGADNRIVRWNGISKIQNSAWEIDDDGDLTFFGAGAFANIYGKDSHQGILRFYADKFNALPYLTMGGGSNVELASGANMTMKLGDDIGTRTWRIANLSGNTMFYMDSIGQFRFYNNMSFWGTSPFRFYMGRGANKDAWLYSSDGGDKISLFFESGVGLTSSHRLSMNSTKIINCANPTAGQDVATKDYVDAYIQGLEWQELVLDKDLTDPPGGESTGDRYIVAAVAGGAWAGHEDDIAEYNGAGWDFFTPVEGWAVWVDDENILYVFDGAAWIPFGGAIDHGNLLGLGDDDHTQYHNNTRGDVRYLYKENTDAFTPDGNYEPATKLYHDQNAVNGTGTNNRLVRWDGVHAVQDSGITVSDSNDMSGVRNIVSYGLIITSGDIALNSFGAEGDFISRDGSVGWTGTFMDANGNTVTIKNGIITNVA